MARVGGKRISTWAGDTLRVMSRAIMRCCVVADTTIMSPKFSISCTAGWMSIGSCTIPSTSYLLSSTRNVNFFRSMEFIWTASRTSFEGIFVFFGAFLTKRG